MVFMYCFRLYRIVLYCFNQYNFWIVCTILRCYIMSYIYNLNDKPTTNYRVCGRVIDRVNDKIELYNNKYSKKMRRWY